MPQNKLESHKVKTIATNNRNRGSKQIDKTILSKNSLPRVKSMQILSTL